MTNVKCPTCEKGIEWSVAYPYRPFCCERCKLIDLGNWADGTYAIPTGSLDSDISAGSLDSDINICCAAGPLEDDAQD